MGTARLLLLSLPNASLHVGLDFSNDPSVQAALSDQQAPPVLLFPGPDARLLEESPPEGPVTLVVVDGTWWQANKLLKLNPQLANLPRYSLSPSAPSRYRIRRAPTPIHISTIEAVVAALSQLEGSTQDLQSVLAPFDALVEQQLGFSAHQNARRHLRATSRKRPVHIPASFWERRTDLVVAYGEANAWPISTPNGPPPEIIHWAAERWETGEFFEAYIQPRFPLSTAFFKHTGLQPEHLVEAEPFEAFKARWAAFLRPNDLLAGWGYYSSSVLEQSGVTSPTRLDIRKLARDYLKEKLGDVHACAAKLAGPLKPPRTAGRAGERLAALLAVTDALLRVAQTAQSP